ncbi:MAG: hypothetical protein ACTSQE_03110 [Candidatus Heimdallarchaeaceae archaeon]
MADSGVIIFLFLVGLSLFIAVRVIARDKKKRKIPKRKYQPYKPYSSMYEQPSYSQNARRHPPTTSYSRSSSQYNRQPSVSAPYQPTNIQTRVTHANADEYYRAGMYDRAKDEYLKTGRIFGAAKSVAAKGKEYVKDALQIINRYAPEREEEMVRNLSRYFFDSGDVEISAQVLYEYGFIEEANAVLATIGKSFEDFEEEPVEVDTFATIEPSTTLDEKKTDEIYQELAAISPEDSSSVPIEPFVSTSTETKLVEEEKSVTKVFEPQPLKIATTDIDERCSVCLGTIKGGESFVRCPHCDKPAHYSHLVEWLKVKSQCPNCRGNLSPKMFRTA